MSLGPSTTHDALRLTLTSAQGGGLSGHTTRCLVSDAWMLYQATQLSAHAGESECRALEDAFLSGASAAFSAVFGMIDAAEDLTGLRQRSERSAEEL